MMITKDHGGQTASPSLLAEVEIDVVLLVTLGLPVDTEVVNVDRDKLSHVRHK